MRISRGITNTAKNRRKRKGFKINANCQGSISLRLIMKIRNFTIVAPLLLLSLAANACWNGSGVCVRSYDWTDDRDASIPITASRMDTDSDGFATGITESVNVNGENTMTADFVPTTDGTYDLGTTSAEWQDLWLDGTANIDTIVSGAITSSGVLTALTLEATGDTSAADNAAMGYTATEGLILTGQGSTNDVTIKNDADADVIKIPTGTTNVDIVGNLTSTDYDGIIGSNTAAAGTFTTLIGTNIDGIIGANTPAAGTFTDVTANSEIFAGKAVSTIATAGAYFSASGNNFSRDSGTVLDLNRTGSAGNVVVVYDDGSANAAWKSNGDLIAGDTSAGATSAATLYATGAGKFSTGSSGATANTSNDDLVVEGSGATGTSVLAPDAQFATVALGSPSANRGARWDWKYSTLEARMTNGVAGSSIIFRPDNSVVNLTLSGGSGSELTVAAGDFRSDSISFDGGTNVLGDYTESTFTPVLADASSGGNASPTAGSGRSTRIGRMVYVDLIFANVDTTGLTAGNDVYIRDFPYDQQGGSMDATGTVQINDVTFTGSLVANMQTNTDYVRLWENASGSSGDHVIVSELTSGSADIKISISYVTDE